MIQMIHVHKTYPNQFFTLSDINLEISTGEFVFIAGPSGSGKTTIMRLLFCAEKATSGEVIVNGIQITQGFGSIHQLRRTMGIVFQDSKLLQDRSVSENIALALEVRGQFGRGVRDKVSDALFEVGLKGREKDSIFSLSAGERQRVAIARALITHPPLLLLDEPTGNLDRQMTADVMEIFSQLHQKGTTIVLATHNTELLHQYPYRRITLQAGKLVEDETGPEATPGGTPRGSDVLP
jgi:cell division transport system ATP-binding protein